MFSKLIMDSSEIRLYSSFLDTDKEKLYITKGMGKCFDEKMSSSVSKRIRKEEIIQIVLL